MVNTIGLLQSIGLLSFTINCVSAHTARIAELTASTNYDWHLMWNIVSTSQPMCVWTLDTLCELYNCHSYRNPKVNSTSPRQQNYFMSGCIATQISYTHTFYTILSADRHMRVCVPIWPHCDAIFICWGVLFPMALNNECIWISHNLLRWLPSYVCNKMIHLVEKNISNRR